MKTSNEHRPPHTQQHDQPEERLPFEVVIEVETYRESVVLADQAKSLDWKLRKVMKKGTALVDVIAETLRKLQAL